MRYSNSMNTLFFSALLFMPAIGCSTPNSNNLISKETNNDSPAGQDTRISSNKDSLRKNIAKILLETSPWSIDGYAPYIVHSNKLFSRLHENSCDYIDSAKKIVSSTNTLSEKEEIILAEIFYNLPLGEYLAWLEKIIASHDMDFVSLRLVEYVAFPPADRRPDLYLAYKNTKTHELYHSVSKYPGFSAQTADVMHGDHATWIIKYYSDNNINLPSIDTSRTCD